MRFRHLDYRMNTPVEKLGPAALLDLLERGDLESWAPLAAAIRAAPHGELAETVLRLVDAQPMYGTSTLWREWIEGLRRTGEDATRKAGALGELRRQRGLTQTEVGTRMGISQSDVSKLERRADVRLSTLAAYMAATGGRLRILVRYPDEPEDRELHLL